MLRINRQRVAWSSFEKEVMVVDLKNGCVTGLNTTGSFIWPLLEGLSPEEIAKTVAARFEVSETAALLDVHAFIRELGRLGFVEALT